MLLAQATGQTSTWVVEVSLLEREGTVHTDGTIAGLTRSPRNHPTAPPTTPQV